MKYDPYTVAVVLATGAVVVAGVFVVGGLVGLAVYGARCVGHHQQTRTRAAMKEAP